MLWDKYTKIQAMKILIIEDSRLLADSVKAQLSSSYVVDIVHSGEDGIDHARATDYALIILDLGLPDMNGYDVCYELRSSRISTPILVLSGQKEVDMRVRLLNCGADDYLTKPFNAAELRARIEAVLRRGAYTLPNEQLKVKDLTIDVSRRRVVRAGKVINLRRKEFDILEYLARNQGRTVTRAMILSHVWEVGKESWNNTVDVHIKHLRDKVDKPFSTPLIKTAYGIGYMVDSTG